MLIVTEDIEHGCRTCPEIVIPNISTVRSVSLHTPFCPQSCSISCSLSVKFAVHNPTPCTYTALHWTLLSLKFELMTPLHPRWLIHRHNDKQTNKQTTNSVAPSAQANDTDWATATCRRNLVPIFLDREVSRGERGGSPTVVNLSFLDRSRYFSFQVAPHLSSQGLNGPRSRTTATQNIW
jgi:hypothetical protein